MALQDLAGVDILVVEDTDDSREMLRMALEYCGALVTTAASAEEAKRILASIRPRSGDTRALARYPRARLLVTIRNKVIADLCRELWHSAIGGSTLLVTRGRSTGRLPWSADGLPDSMQRRS